MDYGVYVTFKNREIVNQWKILTANHYFTVKILKKIYCQHKRAPVAPFEMAD